MSRDIVPLVVEQRNLQKLLKKMNERIKCLTCAPLTLKLVMCAKLEEGYTVLFYLPLFLALHLFGTSDDRVALYLKAALVVSSITLKFNLKN